MGISVVRYRASFGSQRPQVRILHSQHIGIQLNWLEHSPDTRKVKSSILFIPTNVLQQCSKVKTDTYTIKHKLRGRLWQPIGLQNQRRGFNSFTACKQFFSVTDSTKHYGCFSKGSNPLRTTNGQLGRGGRWDCKSYGVSSILTLTSTKDKGVSPNVRVGKVVRFHIWCLKH